MIDDYRSLAVFVAVAEAGSLSAAGRRLKLSTSVVSHHLSRLEARQGVTLFFRSTRAMSLTPEGHAALEPARRMVAAGEEAYLADRVPPQTPEELAALDFISVAQLRGAVTLHREGRSVTLEPERIQIEVNSVTSAKSAVMGGLGIWHLPLSEIEDELAQGTLVPVLPDWSLASLGIYAVWPDIGPQKALTRRLIEAFIAKADTLT